MASKPTNRTYDTYWGKNSPDETVQIRRINRKLKAFDEKLCTSGRYGQRLSLGRFYTIDFYLNCVVCLDIGNLDDFEADLPNRQIAG